VTLRLARIGKDLQSRLKRMFDTPLEADATPLEICQAALDEIERKLQPIGRGQRVFPYTRIVVRVVGQTGSDRAALEAAFAGFDARLRERLAELRCQPPRTLEAKVVIARKVPSDWPASRLFVIDYQTQQEATSQAPQASERPPVHITILKGAASRKAYSFTDQVISIGRTADPTDETGRVRRNRIAFLDTADGVTETVGRAHAHIRFVAQSREYRLFDDGSSNGTAIVRHGSTIPVLARDPRGVRVRSGDEIQIGRALLRIAIGPQEADGQSARAR
jgi:pSer/pThr/pTyr-binding forkhead associated (FHA) protein